MSNRRSTRSLGFRGPIRWVAIVAAGSAPDAGRRSRSRAAWRPRPWCRTSACRGRRGGRARPCPRASGPGPGRAGRCTGSGGSVEPIPAAESRSQTAVPRRRFTAFGREEGVLLLVAVQGEVGPVGRRVAAEEVEDAVAARVRPGGERRPGHRRLGRGGRRDPGQPAPPRQVRQVRQLARGEHRLDDRGLQPVQADHDDPAEVRSRARHGSTFLAERSPAGRTWKCGPADPACARPRAGRSARARGAPRGLSRCGRRAGRCPRRPRSTR